jgi:hypothetical protein
MLRVTAILLLLANLVYFAWTQGSLAGLGLAPGEAREPERLQAQVQPDTLRLLNGPRKPVDPDARAPGADAAAMPEPVAPVPAAPEAACWQTAGLTPVQARGLEAALSDLGLARSRWILTEARSAGRWVVYMGRYNDEQMVRKKAELREMKIDFREVSLPSTGPGLALGTFSSEEAVQQALKDLARKGVRSARMAVERPETVTFSLRLPDLDGAELNRIAALGALAGKKLLPCN